jgi:mono/diheme cytochrome c family protein
MTQMQMRRWLALFATLALGAGGAGASGEVPERPRPIPSHVQTGTAGTVPVSDQAVDSAQTLVKNTCIGCHSDRTRSGGLSLQSFDVQRAGLQGETTEKVIRKLRAGQMPPPGSRRPAEASLSALADVLEQQADAHAAEVVPGRRTFQRLNRAEYTRSIRDLLALDVNAGDYLPLDAKSANFDNIADAQLLSPTLMQGYLTAAAEISRLAVGDPAATPREATYPVSRWTSQREQVEGAPYGSRGGVSAVHTFPADGQYRFRVSFYHETTGALYGNGRAALHTADAPEQVEISVDGARVALLDIDRWMNTSDPDGVNLRSEPVAITAGPHRISAAFIRRFEGPAQDLISPLDWSIASTSIADAYGITTLPHLRDLAITGPFAATGVSETPSRRKIFTCQPARGPRDGGPASPARGARDGGQQMVCAREIVARLASQAFRRPVAERDLNALMSLYATGAADGFDAGVRMALEGILASPRFVFRFEERPDAASAGGAYALSDIDLASRVSFFLWAAGPDAELMRVAEAGKLSAPAELERQTRRLLADPRSDVLASRFAAQWLRLQDLDKINPDVRFYPDFDDQLKSSMRRETELFFRHIVREDRPAGDLFSADYTFVDERLATHYGLANVVGPQFRKVQYPDGRRHGLLGHGSILTLTSHADRTSPVLRGKWVMEVLMGTPPPPPPPDVPDLDATAESEDGRLRTVRERMEQHRANPACASCHRMIDPIGLALDNFDATGAWRIRDNGMPVDAASTFYDGTPLNGPADLRQVLLKRSGVLVQTFTENLMTFALGRRLSHEDMPALRGIVRQADAEGQKLSAFVLAIVKSPAFRMKAADGPIATAGR